MAHRHHAHHTDIRGYEWCVDPYHCEPGSHGNIMQTTTCSCGAIRQANINGMRTETTKWEIPV